MFMQDSFFRLAFIAVKRCFSHLNVSQQTNLADLMTSFLSHTSFALWDIASSLSGNTSTKHKHKRLIYFLDSLIIDKKFWKAFSLLLFSLPSFRLKRRKIITLALDATTLKDDFWLLFVTVSFNGRGIPLYLKSWKGVNVSYDYWGRIKVFLKELKEILPKNYPFEIVADIGFEGDTMFKLCNEIGFDFIIRINKTYTVKLAGSQEYVKLCSLDDGYYIVESLGKKAKTPDMVLSVKSKKTENGNITKWYLVGNKRNLNQEEMVERYSTRFWIEEGIKDMKSILHWEKYTEKIPQNERLEKCVIVSCLSYAIQTSIGNQLEMSASERKKTSIFNKFRQTIRRGTEKLKRIILNYINIINIYIMRVIPSIC